MSKEIEKIEPSENTTMTEILLRAFASEGCDPTRCHACKKKIKVGEVFRLIPHKKSSYSELLDEMCCSNCDDAALSRRDKRDARHTAKRYRSSNWGGGFSRPSKEPK